MATSTIAPTETAPARNQRILIIDDNQAIHEDVRKILGAPPKEDAALDDEAAELFGSPVVKSTGSAAFEIDSAYQGQQGLEMVERAAEEGRPYAMAFIDVRMPPGWDGVETISHIWKRYPDLQVVICTAYSDYSWEDMLRIVGRTDSLVILKKPFDNVEVLQLAHTLTQKWTLSHQLRCHLEGLDQTVATRTAELQSANQQLREEMQERGRTEHELRISEERFSKAFNNSPIPMAIQMLASEHFLDVNESFVALTGRRCGELVGHTPEELQLCPDGNAQRELWSRLRKEGTVRELEAKLRAANGEIRECLVSIEAFDLGGKAVALVATLDVSEQRNLENQLRHAQKLEAVGQFASGVAHDFNNMLTVIQGHTRMQLNVAGLARDTAESLRQVSLAADRAAALTRQLLTFSRKQVVQPRVLNLNDTVRNLHNMLQRVIGEHIDLRCEFAPDLPSVFADESNLEQVIINLVVNARDAMADGGQLRIRTAAATITDVRLHSSRDARAGDFVLLTISDTGCGMSPETLRQIFEPFFTTKDVGQGTGLGLASAQSVVAQLQGWIEVSSQPGRGTDMAIFLPASTASVETVAKVEANERRAGNETILLVEDEPAVREIMQVVLEENGYRVFSAGDGLEALAEWAEHRSEIDLVVTDIVMPNGMRGNLLASRLQSERPDLKVIFSSGYSCDFGTESAPLSAGSHFLAKPFTPDVLVNTVRDCLDEALTASRS